jgi:hypothetical protein
VSKCPKDELHGPLAFNQHIAVSVLLQQNTKAFQQHRRIREASPNVDRRPSVVYGLPHPKLSSRAGSRRGSQRLILRTAPSFALLDDMACKDNGIHPVALRRSQLRASMNAIVPGREAFLGQLAGVV